MQGYTFKREKGTLSKKKIKIMKFINLKYSKFKQLHRETNQLLTYWCQIQRNQIHLTPEVIWPVTFN